MKLPRNWAALRHRALRRAGWKSQRNGLHGRLEVHHRDGDRSNNTQSNLEVLTRTEHLLEHHHPDPDREAWTDFLKEYINHA